MESLSQAQAFLTENVYMIGGVLVFATLLAVAAWFWMSRRNVKSDVLENHARVNETTTDAKLTNVTPLDIPPSAGSPEPHMANNQEESE